MMPKEVREGGREGGRVGYSRFTEEEQQQQQ